MASYYVNNVTGNDGNTGGAGDPLKTISHAITHVAAGDTIYVVPTAVHYTDFFTTTVSGTAGNPITITSSTGAMVDVTSSFMWRFESDYWVVDKMNFENYTSWQIQIGGSPIYGTNNKFADHITVQNCYFYNGTQPGVEVCHATYLTVDNCLFRDIRKRVAGQDVCAIDVYGGGDITIQSCLFEDIGSDGVHIGPRWHAIDAVTIQDCYFRVNRPYGSESWQDFSTNVGENGIDVKGYWSNPAYDPPTNGPILIRRCVVSGFYTAVSGQDCSNTAGEPGTGIVVHMNVEDVTIDKTIICDCDEGVGGSYGPYGGTKFGFSFTNGAIYDCDEGVVLYDGGVGQVIVMSSIIDATEGMEVHSTNITFIGNIVDATTYYRFNAGYAEAFSSNCWVNAVPGYATWVSGTDTYSVAYEMPYKISIPADGEMDVLTALRTIVAGPTHVLGEVDFQTERIDTWLHDSPLGAWIRGFTIASDSIIMAEP